MSSPPNASTHYQTDVLIAGGGAAGIAAAVSAARAGAATLLIERQSMFGGMGSAALVHTICGLYLLREPPEAEYAHQGFPKEFTERLRREGGATGPVRLGRLDVLPHDPVAFALVADALLRETAKLTVWEQSELTAARGQGKLEEVEVACGGEVRRIRAKAFVDTTGDANLLSLAGGAVEQVEPARLQRPAYVFALQGLAPSCLDEAGRLRLAHAIVQAVKAGQLPRAVLGTGFRASRHPGEAFCTIDLAGGDDRQPYWPNDPECLARLTATGRAVAKQLIDHLRSQEEGFTSAWISSWPARPGIRESRRAVGRYRLTGADILRGATFPDAVALATWPMELRETPTGPRWRYPENGQPCQIPLRALQSASFSNVLVAGRCLSCDHEAQASIRVMGTCLATGEAAGREAARLALVPA